MTKPFFDIDRAGFARKFANRPKGFVLAELLQNAWDEPITRVDVTAEMIEGSRACRIVVEDDAPEGFADLASVYTLFRDSKKANDPTKRGRFELGEKLVLALAREARITSTTGTIAFEGDKRRHLREKRAAGTRFEGVFTFTRAEFEGMCMAVQHLFPPETVLTTFNGKPLTVRHPIASFAAVLPTIGLDSEGRLTRRERAAAVDVYEPMSDERASIYEMGIPVVETSDRWHVDVGQKVPVNWERNNVPPSYLQSLRVMVLNALASKLEPQLTAAPWVTNALEDERVEARAIDHVLNGRFGAKRVIADPSDPEGTKIAMSEGYTVIPGGALPAAAWSNVRQHGAALPAGQVTPSPKPYDPDGKPEQVIPPSEWTVEMHQRATFAAGLCQRLTGCECAVVIVREPSASWAANFGRGRLCLNYGRLGRAWFAAPNRDTAVLVLLLHEYCHHTVSDHLSADMHKEATRLGAKLAQLCLDNPELFK